MLEGVVQSLLLGYLGSYVKNIQREQLKIGLWKGEVLLENVELNLEAFDNLQFPLSLKQGQVGRLSIKIPWKMLGWDPIIISLENVFIRACQRDDTEWSLDSVERREYAVKKARLDAAEVAKLTRRVSGGVSETKIGQTFISYITAKILDGIQVSIRDLHFIYTNKKSDPEQFVFGLRLSYLSMKGSHSGKLVDNEVHKIVEVSRLGVYCNISQGEIGEAIGSQIFCSARFDSNNVDYILVPCDVALSLVVNRSGQVQDGVPQYSISIELATLVLQLNEIQMQQILNLLDYLGTCHLREKYGRFRPCVTTLWNKPHGWQKMWWQYAQESVLSDIRRRLRKTSWRYLGWRISYRRNYVSLYKRVIQQSQPVDKDILLELEQMEKEIDVDDILTYRSIAERESQEFLLSSTLSNVGRYSAAARQQNEDGSSSKAQRGWINLLSLGMLGAGGTEDSIQFSGVVSDEIVKDIYEVTQFHPSTFPGVGAFTKNGIFLLSIRFRVHQLNATLLSKTNDREITKIAFDSVDTIFKLWEESWNVRMLVTSVEMNDLSTGKAILTSERQESAKNHFMAKGQPFITLEVDMSTLNHEPEMSIKAVFEPFEVTYELDSFLHFWELYLVLESFQFHSKRVISSLNGFEDVNVRLLSKAECIFSNRAKVICNASFSTVILRAPWRHEDSESIMVLEFGSLLFKSKEVESCTSVGQEQISTSSTSFSDMSQEVQLHDLYESFEIVLSNFEVNIMKPNCCQATPVFDRFSASVIFSSCIIPDELALNKFEVHFSVSSISVHFSPSIYGALVGFYSCLDRPITKPEPLKEESRASASFKISADLKCASFNVIISHEVDNSLVLILALGDVDILCANQEAMEVWLWIKTLGINTCTSEGCSSRTLCTMSSMHQSVSEVGISSDSCGERNVAPEGCVLLHYQAQRSLPIVCHTYSIYLTGLDFHIYPDIVGLLVNFFDELSTYGPRSSPHPFKKVSAYNGKLKDISMKSSFEFQNFGFSNFFEDGTSGAEGIPLDHFPFVTIHTSGFIGSLGLPLISSISEWWRHFRVREGQLVGIPKVSFRKRPRVVGFSTSKLLSANDIRDKSGRSYNADTQLIELELNTVNVYFHDSSCILATLTLPLCKSFITQDANCLDVLCSANELLLSSSWATQDISKFLWGYSETNISPILNIRLRKKDNGPLNKEFEVSFSVQHVFCVLPPEFLAILIGYFSLSDWSPHASQKYVSENHQEMGTEDSGIKWNIEILNSKLAIPVEGHKNQSLHLGLQQLYFSFTTMNHKTDALKDIPLDCIVPEHKVADCIRLLNIFGRDISLLLVLRKNEEKVSVKHDESTQFRKVSIISSADIDLWIRIPCEGKPCGSHAYSTCIMTKVDNFKINAEDAFFLLGLDALLSVVNEFSTVGRESEGFKTDVLQFYQLKKILKESVFVSPIPSSATFTEVRFCVKSLSIKLKRSSPIESIPSELIAGLDMQFQFSAAFRDDVPLSLDIRFSSLSLQSFRSSLNLVECMCNASVSSCFDIYFSKSDSGVNEVLLELPSVHMWLYYLEWCDVIELLVSYAEQLGQTSFMNAQSYNSNSFKSEVSGNEIIPVFQNELGSPRLSSSTVCLNVEDSIDLLVRSERIGLLLHYPLLVNNEETLNKSGESENKQENTCNFYSDKFDEAAMLNSRHPQYITLVLHSKDTEISNTGNLVKFSCVVEEASGMLDSIKEERVISWSIFQLFHVTVLARYEKHKMRHTSAEILVDSFDLSVSNKLLSIWPTLGHQVPDRDSSESSLVSMDLNVQLRKASLLLTDSTCSCNGPMLEILLRNFVLHSTTTGSAMKTSLASDLLVNYFNLQKVMWEPFIETWNFMLNMTRTCKQCSRLNSVVVTDFHLTSTTELNLNLTEPMIEVIFRLNEMIKRLCGPVGFNDLGSQRFFGGQSPGSIDTRRYAPYILQNETSLPLLFYVYRGLHNGDDLEILSVKERITVYPGSTVPIYTDETPEEQIFRYRPPQSSDRLNEKKSIGVIHHMISVQLDGTSGPSMPISMDTIGLTHFEVNFSKALEKAVEKNEDALKHKRKVEVKNKTDLNSGFVVPVVLDVSTLHYKKLIRVYSTVILLNTTSITLELRFDMPFGVSPKVLDQIYPGQEFPLPLHLAEAGRLRWRPFGTGFLWSEAHMFSRGLSAETKLGSFRSFICYPSHPSSDPFRCCLSIQLINISSPSERRRGTSIRMNETLKHSVGNSEQNVNYRPNSRTPSIHYVTLTTPLLVRNFMPSDVSLTIESGGVTHTVLISEVESASFYHIDSSHDLGLIFNVHGFGPSISKFPRAEAFVAVARFHDNKFSQTETLTFYPDSSNGPIYVTVEKTMDALSGARELCIFVPFLLYNCTGLPITVADLGHEMEGCTMPPCYHLIEMDQHLGKIHSPILLSSIQDSYANRSNNENLWNTSKNHSISMTQNEKLHQGSYLNRHVMNKDPSTCFLDQSGNMDLSFQRALNNPCHQHTSNQSQYSRNGEYGSDPLDFESRKVKACMYFPHSSSSASELMVRLSICMPTLFTDNKKNSVWSSPFYLVPASGSTCVVVPQTNTSGAFIVSVTSSPLAGPFSGRTRAIIFQPRYVIINACSKDLCYKQKGAESVFHLGIGQQSHLHWDDPTRELLVSLVFNEPGWLWSGSFFPDHVGDTQVKMRNYVRGELSLIRVEVQNADVSIREEKIVGTPNGNSGTLLILLSDDKTGFMPYRIDNFSKERLRIYQEKCKTFETTVHSYMSCPYTWDEPCFPHRLVVEVLGERILGSYNLDEVIEQLPIYLASTSEKPGRQLFLSIQSDGAVKVLSIMDSSYLPKDMDSCFSVINEKRRFDLKEEIIVDYCERISVHLPFVGVSLIQSSPQELLFASAKDTRIDLMQSVEQQKFSFQIQSLQVDNQLHNTAYPVILSLDYDHGGNSGNQMKNKDDSSKLNNEMVLDVTSERPCQPIFLLSAVKGRNKESSLVFFEYIMLRLAPLRIELEEEVVLCLFDFFRNVVSMMHSGVLPCLDSTVNSLAGDTGSLYGLSVRTPHYESLNVSRGQHFPMSVSKYLENCLSNPSLPSVVPIEDFWQQIYILARKQNKIYVEEFDLAPIRLTLSFSSAPWMFRNEGPTSAEYPRPISGTAFQRGLMALADVEGAPVNLKQLYIAHHMGTSESFHEILIRHYTPQLLHEMYKIFGSASVIGNPMGFAKNLGLGIKDFLSVPATGNLKNPTGLFTGMARGTSSLFYSTVYAISSAATQFSKSVHKSIVAFTFDDRAVSTMEKQWTDFATHSKGVLNEFLEGLTGFLQSPIQGAEKHGLPGFLSGVALGTAGLVARPMASILEVTGRTAQSIRNRSLLHRSHRFRVRFPRPLSRERPLQPYSWEEAIGISILLEVDGAKFKDELFVTCKTLKHTGRFLVITERLVLVIVCSSLVAFGTPEFHGIADPQWVVEVELSLNNVIYAGREVEQVNIVGINSVAPLKQHQHRIGIRRAKWWIQSNPLPLFQTMSIEFAREEEAESVLRVILSIVEQKKEQASRVLVLHRSNIR